MNTTTKWYKTPLALILAVCLTLGGLPMVAMADDAVTLGYSITGIDASNSYTLGLAHGSNILVPVSYVLNGAGSINLDADGFTVRHIISEDVGVGLEPEEEGWEEQYESWEEQYESWMKPSFYMQGNSLYIKLEIIQDPIVTNGEDDVLLDLEILHNNNVVQAARGIKLHISHDTRYVQQGDSPIYMEIGRPVIEPTEDISGAEIIVDYNPEFTLTIFADLEAGERYYCEADTFASWYGATWKDELPEATSLNITEAIELITINFNQDGFQYRIDTTDPMTVYKYDGTYEEVGVTGKVFDTYSYEYFLVPIEEDNGGGTTVTPPVSGGGSGGSGRGGSSSSGGRNTPDGSANTSTTTTTTASRSNNVSSNGAVNQNHITNDVAQAVAAAAGNVATVQTRNATSISSATLRAMAQAAGDKSVVLHADTLTENGRAVQGRLYVEPDKLAGLSSDLLLSVKIDNKSTQAVERFFESHFGNDVEVIHCDQQGSFGASLQIAAKVDLSKLNNSSLVFYSYDRSSNAYTRIANPNYSIDSNGYLHFYTEKAGDIIVTDSLLSSK